MRAKPRVAIVGAGNLGSALGVALHRVGYVIETVVALDNRASLKSAGALAEKVGARAATDLSGMTAELIWFCVPDGEIQHAALAQRQSPHAFAKNASTTGHPGFSWTGKTALHSSGALSSDELSSLRERGAAVASMHPMMTFVRGQVSRWDSAKRSGPPLAGVSFAVEGDARAVRVARRVVKDLGGVAYAIRKQDKVAYHAWGTFASPLLTALLATAEEVAALAGVKRSEGRRRMMPMVMQTLANYTEFGAANGFSGPIVRGDVETVRRHLDALRGTPAAREVYVALARAATEYLPGKNQAALRNMLATASRRKSRSS